MLGDVLRRCLEQRGDLTLRQPDGAIDQAQLQFVRAIFGAVDDDLPLAFAVLVHALPPKRNYARFAMVPLQRPASGQGPEAPFCDPTAISGFA
jgi:hypothetical protein